MSDKIEAMTLDPMGCVKAAARFRFRAVDACVVRNGSKPDAVEIGPKTMCPGKIGFITLCPDTIACGLTVSLSECFSDPVPFSIGTYNGYVADFNYSQCLKEGDEGFVASLEEDSILAEGVIDVTGKGDLKRGGVVNIPLGENGEGFVVGKDPITLVICFGEIDLTDCTMGSASICLEAHV